MTKTVNETKRRRKKTKKVALHCTCGLAIIVQANRLIAGLYYNFTTIEFLNVVPRLCDSYYRTRKPTEVVTDQTGVSSEAIILSNEYIYNF